MNVQHTLGANRHWAAALGIAGMAHGGAIALTLGALAMRDAQPLPEPVMVLELAPIGERSQAATPAAEPDTPQPDQAERSPAPQEAEPLKIPEIPAPVAIAPLAVPTPMRPAPTRAIAAPAAPAAPARQTTMNAPDHAQERSGNDPKAKAAEVNYFALVSAHLNRRKKYPAEARKAMQQGIVTVRFTVSRNGNVSGVSIKRGSGHALLDQATLDLLQRVAPLPKFPRSMARDSVTLSLPIEYSLRTN